MINVHYVHTNDSLKLQGVEYRPDQRDVCVLFVHGMSGNFIENDYANILGIKFAENGIGFLYGHNRGYGHVNDIRTSNKTDNGYVTKRIGASYEIFDECILDIDAWVTKVKELGYEKIILAGHSLGVPKVLYYNYKNKPDLLGMNLMSPADMIGLIKAQMGYEKLFKEARRNVAEGKPLRLLSEKIWDWYSLSSQTFLSLFDENGVGNNLPIHDSGGDYSQLESIKSPLLVVMGEKDDVGINSLESDIDLIGKKAINTKSFSKVFISKANHNYEDCEVELAEVLLKWLKQL